MFVTDYTKHLLDNVKKIMDMETMKSGQQTLSKTGCYGIDFDNVTFNYTQGGKDALSDVDIHLEPGNLNAFVGPSGAGKTTAVQLLGRYWDVSSGTIKIGGFYRCAPGRDGCFHAYGTPRFL